MAAIAYLTTGMGVYHTFFGSSTFFGLFFLMMGLVGILYDVFYKKLHTEWGMGRGDRSQLVPNVLVFNLFRQALDGLDDHIKFHFNPIEKIQSNRYRKADFTDEWNDLIHYDYLFSDRMGIASL